MEILFWAALLLLAYTYVGYGAVVYLLLRRRGNLSSTESNRVESVSDPAELPEVTLVVAAYNEEAVIRDKVRNSRRIDYPSDKLRLVFVTDGSTDRTVDLLRAEEGIAVLHEPGRAGKMAAVNRAMEHIDSPIVVFTDANAMLNPESVREIVHCFEDPSVGAVAGEKRIRRETAEAAGGSGEGLYWRYESLLKQWDAELFSVVGAAGELFAVRRELFRPVEPDTVLDDFVLSLRIAESGFRVAYAPNAYAEETPSASIREELKRKVRICAGGFQAIVRLPGLLNPLRHGLLTFQYVSHRVLRWTLAPLALVLLLPLNALLASESPVYAALWGAQLLFYGLAVLGGVLQSRRVRVRALFVPFYFFLMNLSAWLGFVRFLTGRQSVLWAKAARA